MDGALHNNSSLLKITHFGPNIETPVVDLRQSSVNLTLWCCWASEPRTTTLKVHLITIQVWAYCPGAISYKEVAN